MLHLKLVNATDQSQRLTLDIDRAVAAEASLYTLHATTRFATNSIDRPDFIKPVVSKEKTSRQPWTHVMAPNSIGVLDVPVR